MTERPRCFRQALARYRPTGSHIAPRPRRRLRMLSSSDLALFADLLHQLDSAELRHTTENESWSVFWAPHSVNFINASTRKP